LFNLKEKENVDSEKIASVLPVVLKYLIIFVLLSIGCFGINLYLEDFNQRFIECTYMFILRVPDLQPNLGVFWYFFIEMFEHFREFFTYVFQINVFIYVIPLTIRLRHNSLINIIVQIGLIAILKSYPSIGETGLYLSFLPIFAFLFPFLRSVLIYSCMLVASSVLAPIMFYLWLGSGGGNANFYFAITLVHTIGQIFLLVDVIYAALKREFIKLNGYKVPMKLDEYSIFSLE
jgi:GPI-anchor transamidase subunit U